MIRFDWLGDQGEGVKNNVHFWFRQKLNGEICLCAKIRKYRKRDQVCGEDVEVVVPEGNSGGDVQRHQRK